LVQGADKRGERLVEPLLNSKQATDLVGLLAAVSEQSRLGREYRDAAGYWAGQVHPGLDEDDPADDRLAAGGHRRLAIAARSCGAVGKGWVG
jgi:hypothetical protein